MPLDAPPPGETTSLGIDVLIDGRLNPRPAALFADPPKGKQPSPIKTLVGAADAFTNHLFDGHKEREAVSRRLQAIVEDEPLPQILYHPTTTIAFTGDGNGLVACDGKEVLTFNAKSGNFQEAFTLPSVMDDDDDHFNMSTFCLTHDGSEIVITPSWPGGEARVIDVNSGETISTLHFELCNVGQAVFSANNEFLATYHECEDWEWPMRILLWRGRDFEAVRTALDPDEPGAIKPTDGFEALLQPTAKVDEPTTASKGKRKAHGEQERKQPIHGESYDTYTDGIRRSVRNRSGGASSSADWSAAPKARSG